jgi:hypothetical protein
MTRTQRLLLPFFYAVIACVITFPAITQLATHGIGAGYGDQFENAHMIWYVQYALQHGLNPFYQTLLAWPTGFFSAPLWAEPLTYLPAVPLAFLFGSVAAYNLYILIALMLNGCAAFALCWHLGKRYLPALIGGLIFMTYPTLQGHLSGGHSGVVALYAFPIFVLCLWRVVRERAGWRIALLGGMMFWLTALANGVQVVFTLFPISLFFLGWHWRQALSRQVLPRLLVMYGLGVALCVPFFAPLFFEVLKPDKTADLQETGWVTYSADPLGFIAPSPFTPWGKALAPGYTRQVLGTNTVEGTAYLSVVVVILAGIGLWARRDQPVWLFIALGCMLFSLGPLLKFLDQPLVYKLGNEYQSYIVTPYALIQSLPFINSTRTPGRYNLVTGLALAVLASFGLNWLLSRVSRAGGRIVLVGVLTVAILVDYQLFWPALTTEAAIPSYFAELAKRTDVRAVFDLPWDNNLVAKEAIHYQTLHQKPLIAGHVVRRTPVDPVKLNLIERTLSQPLDRLPDVLPFLEQQGVDAIIAHKPFVSVAQLQALSSVGEKLYEDERVAVFLRAKVANPESSPLYALGTGDFYLSAPMAIRLDNLPEGFKFKGQPISAGNYAIVQLAPGFYPLPAAVTPRRAENFTAADVVVGGLRYRGVTIEQTDTVVRVGTLWQADSQQPTDYHFFVHLVDSSGKIVDQFDTVPAFAPTQWQIGQQWFQAATLEHAPPGEYTLYAGWYSYPDLVRLPVAGSAKGAADGLVYLGEVQVR